jgi:hypothetical protein
MHQEKMNCGKFDLFEFTSLTAGRFVTSSSSAFLYLPGQAIVKLAPSGK